MKRCVLGKNKIQPQRDTSITTRMVKIKIITSSFDRDVESEILTHLVGMYIGIITMENCHYLLS